jgi:cation diffusion facilitator CzcD-associated flavoprotein CzcO
VGAWERKGVSIIRKEIGRRLGMRFDKKGDKGTDMDVFRLREPAVDERDRKDYYTPSRELFADQCRQIVDHYCLRHTPIMRERVEDIDYSNCGTEDGSHSFTIRTNKQQVYRARVVVLAVGHGASPTIPGLLAGQRIDGACHAMQIAEFPDPTLKAKVAQGQTTNVLVVGGGLTSAQIADLAIRRGVTKVWHLMRSGLKVKPFDLGLEWLGKFRNVEQSAFWSADSDEERLEQIRTARNGGSITPKYLKVLRDHVAKGALSLFTNTVVTSRSWDSRSRRWTVTTEPNHDLPPMDYIYYATGMKPDVHSVPFLQTILRKYPIQTCGGLPCINHDLMWNNQVPLLITGGLGALRIGPGAANLSGARSAAERVAWSIADLLPQREEDEDGVKSYHLGIGSRFVALDGN